MESKALIQKRADAVELEQNARTFADKIAAMEAMLLVELEHNKEKYRTAKALAKENADVEAEFSEKKTKLYADERKSQLKAADDRIQDSLKAYKKQKDDLEKQENELAKIRKEKAEKEAEVNRFVIHTENIQRIEANRNELLSEAKTEKERFKIVSDSNKLMHAETIRFINQEANAKIKANTDEIAELSGNQRLAEEQHETNLINLDRNADAEIFIINKALEKELELYKGQATKIAEAKKAANELIGKIRENLSINIDSENIQFDATLKDLQGKIEGF